jgi:hypothetical protein
MYQVSKKSKHLDYKAIIRLRTKVMFLSKFILHQKGENINPLLPLRYE